VSLDAHSPTRTDRENDARLTELEDAIVRRLARLHDAEHLDLATVDRDASFFAPTGFALGERVLDSLDLVEMIVTFEVDFRVQIVEDHDVRQFDSISKLTRLLMQIAQQADRAEFQRSWRPRAGSL
jgi:hypothetical protein